MSSADFMEKLLDGVAVEWMSLGEVCVVKTGPNINKTLIAQRPGPYPVINSGREPLGYVDHFNTQSDPIGIASRGSVGLVTWTPGRFFRGNLNYSCSVKNAALLDARFLYHYLLHADAEIQALATHQGIPALNARALKTLLIPIPSKEIQIEVVRILDAFTELTAELTAELDARKKQYNHYRDQLLSFEDGEVEWKILGEVCDVHTGGEAPASDSMSRTPTDIYKYPIYGNGAEVYGYTDSYKINKDATTISSIGANTGTVYFRKAYFTPIIRLKVLMPKDEKILSRYLFHALSSISIGSKSSSVPNMNAADVKRISIPVPPIAKQARIIAILDKFDALTNSITEGLPREIELRQKQYEYYRDLLLSFPKPQEVAA